MSMNRPETVKLVVSPEAPVIKRIVLLIVIYLAFVSLGLPDGVLGLAWPGMRASLGQPLESLGLVTFVLASCSAVSGFMSGRLLSRFGTGPVTFVSALMTGLALLGLSQVPNFPLMVALAFPLGLGGGSVDAGLNHYVADHYSSKHMNWLHACWGVGATLGPVIVGAILAAGGGWSRGYLTIACCQLALACVLLASLGLWKHQGAVRHDPQRIVAGGRPDTPRWAPYLSAFLFALYVAIEMGAGMWSASILIESRHFDPGLAGLAITLFYGAIMGGRVLVGFVSERVGNRRLIRIGLSVAILGITLLMIPGSATQAIVGLLLLGLGGAPVYPSLMHETPRRFDPETTGKVIGWQVAAANIGGAIIPAAFGLLAAWLGLEAVFPAIAAIVVLLLVLSIRLDKATS
jgi:MFS family permease